MSTGYISAAKVENVSRLFYNDNAAYSAATNGSPSFIPRLRIFGDALVEGPAAGSWNIDYKLDITYYVEFFNKRQLAE